MSRRFVICALALLVWIAGAQPPFLGNLAARPQSSEPAAEGHCLALGIAVDEPAPPGAAPGGPLRINATFEASVTTAQRAVIQQAINEWQAIIQDAGSTPNPYPITFRFRNDASEIYLAVTSVTFNSQTGDLIRADMTFNTRYTFFVDPTPADDSEFTGGSPPANYDLLSIARHELGHALGWTDSRRVTDLMSGSAFNPPRLNIPIVTATGTHVDPAWLAGDVMVPTIGTSTRRPISLYPTAGLVARAYGYRVPMQFIDGTHTGTETGTAQQPWRRLATACGSSPVGVPLLLANSTHLVPVNFSCASRHDLNAARGGAVIRP